jgi:hypothetical protein
LPVRVATAARTDPLESEVFGKRRYRDCVARQPSPWRRCGGSCAGSTMPRHAIGRGTAARKSRGCPRTGLRKAAPGAFQLRLESLPIVLVWLPPGSSLGVGQMAAHFAKLGRPLD